MKIQIIKSITINLHPNNSLLSSTLEFPCGTIKYHDFFSQQGMQKNPEWAKIYIVLYCILTHPEPLFQNYIRDSSGNGGGILLPVLS